MTTQTKFTPIGVSVNITNCTTSGASVALTKNASANRGELQHVFNSTDVEVFVAFGGSGVTTTTETGFPLAVGGSFVFELGPDATHMAADVASNATGDIIASPGL